MDDYHQKYSEISDSEIQNRVYEKKEEIKLIFSNIHFNPTNSHVQIAVLGCADKRLIKEHKKIFEEVLGKEAAITTFDITTEHLADEESVVEHDCTLPLPGNYDISYAHVLLKFIAKQKQWDVIINSYNALNKNGIAIHILDKDDYESEIVLLDELKKKLKDSNINYTEIEIKYGKALILIK